MKQVLDNYLVEKYPKIFADRNKGPKETLMCFGFEHDDGWFWLLDQLCDSIQQHIDNTNKYAVNGKTIPQVVATQVKEKYGSLDFNYYGGDVHIDGMIMFVSNLSDNICEICGTTKNVGKTKGWYVTCCEECHNKEQRISNLKWQENENIPKNLLRKIKLNNLNN